MGEDRTEGRTEGAQYITVGEAAQLLGVHRNTVRNRIKDGRIKAHKVIEGEREVYRIDANSLDVGRTSADMHNKVAQRTTSGSDVVQMLVHRIDQLMQDYNQQVGDIREQLGEERGRRLRVEEENERLRQELEALRETRDSPETATEDPYLTHAPPVPERPVERPESGDAILYGTSADEAEAYLQRRSGRSWWRRFFGFE